MCSGDIQKNPAELRHIFFFFLDRTERTTKKANGIPVMAFTCCRHKTIIRGRTWLTRELVNPSFVSIRTSIIEAAIRQWKSELAMSAAATNIRQYTYNVKQIRPIFNEVLYNILLFKTWIVYLP